jgi:hypothetical protein
VALSNVLPIKGHQLEVGRESVPPLGDKSHLVFVEPLDRVIFYQVGQKRVDSAIFFPFFKRCFSQVG